MADGTNTSTTTETIDAATWKLVRSEVRDALIELRRGQGELLSIVIKLARSNGDGRYSDLLADLHEVVSHIQGPAITLDWLVECPNADVFAEGANLDG